MPVSNVSNIQADINAALMRIREASNGSPQKTQQTASAAHPFGDVMSLVNHSVENVNTTQQTSDNLKNAFLVGSKDVSMSQVIVASQQSKMAFEGLLAVRNKILEAYKEIMNMPV